MHKIFNKYLGIAFTEGSGNNINLINNIITNISAQNGG